LAAQDSTLISVQAAQFGFGVAIAPLMWSIFAITGLWVPARWHGRERRYAALMAGIGAFFLTTALLGWGGWVATLMGAGALVLSVLAVTGRWTRSKFHLLDLPFAVLMFGCAVTLIPGGVYLLTDDEMHGAVPTLTLIGLAVFVAGFVFLARRESRRRRENGTDPVQ
jgi:hypothetical protein